LNGQFWEVIQPHDRYPRLLVGTVQYDGHAVAGVFNGLFEGGIKAQRLHSLDLEMHAGDGGPHIGGISRTLVLPPPMCLDLE
jgi:hypothetical protein